MNLAQTFNIIHEEKTLKYWIFEQYNEQFTIIIRKTRNQKVLMPIYFLL